MIRRPPRSTLLTHSFPTRRSSDLFNITRAALGKRYTPELNIELPVRRGLLAIARDPIFIDSMCELANNVDEARHHAASNKAQLLARTPSAASAATLDASFRAISLSIRTSAMGPTDIEIGRASCRERVCQYVYIRVVVRY